MDNRPRAHVCSRWPHHRRRRRHPTQRHRPDASGRLFHLCRAACRYSLQNCLPHRHVGSGRSTDQPLSHRPCGMERLCRAMRAAIFISERTRRAERTYRLRLRHVRARGRGVLLRPDNATDDIRTFRCDRIVRAWRPSKAYAIPADFNLNDYLFFEFDFADRPPVAATFSFGPQTQIDMINGLTRGRGELAHTDAGWTWTVDVRDLEAAASFCMAHAMDGMRPMAPKSLKQAWNHLIERTVHEHARA